MVRVALQKLQSELEVQELEESAQLYAEIYEKDAELQELTESACADWARDMKLKRGMIIDVNLEPTLGSETGKIRPCIIVTNNTYNERVPVIQVVPITNWNQKKARIKTNIVIEPSSVNGLSKKSWFRLFANSTHWLSFSLNKY